MKYSSILNNKTPINLITQIFSHLVEDGGCNTYKISAFQKDKRKKPKQYKH